jgi:hypothetical protein
MSYNSFVSLAAASTVESRDLGNVAAHSLIPLTLELAASLKLLADSGRTSRLSLDGVGVFCRTMGACFVLRRPRCDSVGGFKSSKLSNDDEEEGAIASIGALRVCVAAHSFKSVMDADAASLSDDTVSTIGRLLVGGKQYFCL